MIALRLLQKRQREHARASETDWKDERVCKNDKWSIHDSYVAGDDFSLMLLA